MDDVAQAAGVSRALVSLVMRQSPKVSDKRRAAVLEAADRLGYRPNLAARSLAERRSKTLGVVINDLHNTFFADVVDGIHDVADEHGYRLLLNTAWRTDADEQRAIEAFLEYRVDAVLVVGARAGHDVIRHASVATPLVSIGTPIPDVDVVVNDDQRGGELVVDYLTGLGHTDIVHIDGGVGGGAKRRRTGFAHAMAARNLPIRVLPGDYTEQSGVDGVDLLIDSGEIPTAIFAANDLSAIAVIDRLGQSELRVPDDVSVVGYDNTSLAGLGHIGLSTIHQPRVEMGRVATLAALERIEGGRREAVRHVVSPELVIRSTTAPPRTVRRMKEQR
jgi:DNA-binding LacI/PurR family transcriptional regulator